MPYLGVNKVMLYLYINNLKYHTAKLISKSLLSTIKTFRVKDVFSEGKIAEMQFFISSVKKSVIHDAGVKAFSTPLPPQKNRNKK